VVVRLHEVDSRSWLVAGSACLSRSCHSADVGVFTFLLWIVTFRLSKGVWSIFLLLWITFFFLAGGDFGYLIGSWNCGKIGGFFGLLTGIDALLVAFIEVLNATAGRVVISLGRPILRG
jgi:hypothetical protein